PSRSTLFPYTTLFRSGFAFMDMLNRATAAFARFTTGLADSAGFQRFAQAMISVLDSMHGQLWRTLMPLLQTLLTTLFRVGLALQDRKSTRLNSSHVKI